ncbi:N-acetyltransferase family protein [Mangrovibacterium sp.]|uniref:GNAT family N-acetyltransferase n=1 Tax=Mangrovibacterium sp. TaxID=1961364 RepID=UPI00356AC0F4
MSKKVEIRMATPEDAKSLLAIYEPFITNTVVTFEEIVPSVSEFGDRISTILKESPFLLCQIDDEIAGYAYASQYRSRESYRWNREVTVYIKESFQSRNIGTALYTALINIVKHQNYTNLLAIVTLPNDGSVRLHERMGFKACAVFNQVGFKMNQWHQVGWWELPLIPATQKPLEPVLLPNFTNQTLLNEIMLKAVELVKI